MMRRRSTRRHIPQRTCVACHTVRPKWELIRLVRIADDDVEIDLSGKKLGRGAYLCRKQTCWEEGMTSGRVEYTLRATLTQDKRDQLIKASEKLWL